MGVEDGKEEEGEAKKKFGSFGAKLFACQIDGGQHVGNAAATGIELNCTDYKVQASSNTGLRIKRLRNCRIENNGLYVVW